MNEYMNAAMVMIQKIIAAATPVAKQAYEIALLTLQIDAGSVLFFGLIILIVSLVVMNYLRKTYSVAVAKAKENRSTIALPGDGAIHAFGTCFALGGFLVSGIILLNVWLWVKLIRPELWLAHMAIEKLVK